MKPEEAYLAWAPRESIWSPWAIPVPFAQIVCLALDAQREINGIETLANILEPESDLAVVLDLPGDEAVRLSLALALRGFRPVPVMDGSPGPDILGNSQAILGTGPALSTQASVAVDMRQTLRWLCIGAAVLPTLKIAPNASPVFLLDALRMGRMHTPGMEVFDNRWKTFPQDFPSRSRNPKRIHRVIRVFRSRRARRLGW